MSNAMKLGKDTGSLTNYLMSGASNPPVVGQGATLLSWTDRYAYFVDSVSADGKECTIERALATRADSNGTSDAQSYRYERHEPGNARKATLRYRHGKWREKYECPYTGATKYRPINICFGTMREYYDFSF